MLVRPTVTDLLEKVDNRYSLIIMTAKSVRDSRPASAESPPQFRRAGHSTSASAF